MLLARRTAGRHKRFVGDRFTVLCIRISRKVGGAGGRVSRNGRDTRRRQTAAIAAVETGGDGGGRARRWRVYTGVSH